MSTQTMTRREWIDLTKRRLDEWDHALTELEDRVSTLKEETSAELTSRLRATRAAVKEARERWNGATDTASNVWDTVSEEMGTAWEINKLAIERSIDEVREALTDDGKASTDASEPASPGDGPTDRGAEAGDAVLVHYRGAFEDGSVFGTSVGRGPLEFTLGQSQVIPGVDHAILGMVPGERKSTVIPPDQGYGPRRADLVLTVARSEFPGDEPPALGDRFELSTEDGRAVPVTVRRVEHDTVEVDANHPLAGHELHFDLELVKIV